MKHAAKTVTEFLAELPGDRSSAIRAVRAVIQKHVPKGYAEAFTWGMITWSVPLEIYPDTYNRHPLMYVALGSQKNYMVIHLVCAYMNPVLQKKLADGFKAAGKKLDMGKGCLRFKKLDDLPLEVIAEVAAAVPMRDYVEIARQAHSPQARAKRSAARKADAERPSAGKTRASKAAVKRAVKGSAPASKPGVKRAVASRPAAKAPRARQK
jgi:hypothetical protein